MKSRILAAAFACGAAALTGCGPTPGPFHEGDVLKPTPPWSEAAPCDRARWEAVTTRKPFYSSDYAAYLHILAHGEDTSRRLSYTFDLEPGDDGLARPVNIRFVGPLAYLDNRGTQPAIRSNGEALAKWEYAWRGDGAPPFARDCAIAFELIVINPDR